ncbi:DUF2272 domain-containing protein [Tanticharoenia sakaeratensis]|uniref:DUF2272 domain-containing protein n=1 Tax=Tanticharoenia sakaeratensis NBRC 103193 TaxID=1231623 RepID=A0A0D6MMC5_9PROT|nr:DUF2272 domain-containing protein [Tanticharoenia sakaeratensis]GAN54580.1 hypothetical protein Tasa_025_011 [Tanticharoenia sakaeratensis NBRC 103193]GBQ22912.1 hypothetical protein AA103193_2229 [Tanticharoenia sakaeratensis NBRC 103193]
MPRFPLPRSSLAPSCALLTLTALAGCAETPKPSPRPVQTPVAQYRTGPGPVGADDHVPDFASRNFVPFNRQDVPAIAMREWRMFGSPVDDDDPEARPDAAIPALKPERIPGLWQRIGEYWWIGQDPYETEVNWTGKTDADGTPFAPENDGRYAWSAAFISYVMRVAGANDRFPYSPNHSTYINAAVSGQSPGLRAHDPATYIPKLGDLLCVGRGRSKTVTFAMLPTSYGFPAHCGFVVAVNQNAPPFGHELSIIGGNVDDAVTLTHVPTSPTGALIGDDGKIIDNRYPWAVILEVLYDADFEPGAGQ